MPHAPDPSGSGQTRSLEISLDQLAVGCRGTVIAVSGDAEVRRRLLEMGFCNGVEVEVVRRAPLGDPIQFRLRGYYLSLRDEQARFVRIAPLRPQAG